MNMEPLYAEFEAAKVQGRQRGPLQLVQEPAVFRDADVAQVARGRAGQGRVRVCMKASSGGLFYGIGFIIEKVAGLGIEDPA